MFKKKVLNNEELEKVTGGETYTSLDKLSFLYGTGLHVEVHVYRLHILPYQFTEGGTIEKRGYTHTNGKFSPCYYIKCKSSSYTGWYDEDYLQDTTYSSWDKIDESKTPVTVIETND